MTTLTLTISIQNVSMTEGRQSTAITTLCVASCSKNGERALVQQCWRGWNSVEYYMWQCIDLYAFWRL